MMLDAGLTRSVFEINMNKVGPHEEGGMSEKALCDWLESHMLGLWPESEGIEDKLPSEDSDIS